MLSGSHKDKLIPNYLISVFICDRLHCFTSSTHFLFEFVQMFLQISKLFTNKWKKNIAILLGFYSLKCSHCNKMSKNVLWQCFVSFFLSAVDLVCRNNWVLKQFILLEKNSKKLNWESDNDDNLSLITQSSRREKIHCRYFWTVGSYLAHVVCFTELD